MPKEYSEEKEGDYINNFWKKVLGILQVELNPMTFNTWVLVIKPDNLGNTSIDLTVPDNYIKNQLQKFSSLIQDAVDKVAKKHLAINFVVDKAISADKKKEIKPIGPLFENSAPTGTNKDVQNRAGLSPKFTFENFIMGNSNQLAFAISQNVAENPGSTYNPFFLYAGVGLGKTHLLHAIGNKIIQTNPKINVVYTTGEAFMNELIESIQSGKGRGKYTSNEFRNKFRKTDVLLIDDIQFIIGREATQLEFFHTFNTLFLAGKQIVLTSDRPPKEFTNLEKRITSRFGSGIIADIQQPDVGLRNAILRNKRDLNKDSFPNEVIDFIARSIDSNIRELEGAYLQVLTFAKAAGQLPSVEIAGKILGKHIHVNKKKSINPSQILKVVCHYYSVKSLDLKGKSRTKEIVIPRQIAMYLLRDLTETPLMTIGDYLGGRDHTTIMHGIKKMEEEFLEMGKIRQDIINLKKML